jgi:hypothetical protein
LKYNNIKARLVITLIVDGTLYSVFHETPCTFAPSQTLEQHQIKTAICVLKQTLTLYKRCKSFKTWSCVCDRLQLESFPPCIQARYTIFAMTSVDNPASRKQVVEKMELRLSQPHSIKLFVSFFGFIQNAGSYVCFSKLQSSVWLLWISKIRSYVCFSKLQSSVWLLWISKIRP